MAVSPSTESLSAATQSDTADDLSAQSLALLQQELVNAHAAARQGQFEECYAAYQSLADHFAQAGNMRRAKFFYHKCLDIAQEQQWQEGEAAASLNLGMVCPT